MISHYNEHAANERTLLAWLRTSLAVIGFGFLMEKFEYFIAQHDSLTEAGKVVAKADARIIGFCLVGVGLTMMTCSIFRYLHIRKNIETSQSLHYGKLSGTLLIGILIAFIILVMMYLGIQLAA